MTDAEAATSRQVGFNCFLCAACCGMYATVEGNTITKVVADRDHPASHGYSCEKGRNIARVHHAENRLDRPRIDGAEVEWTAFVDELATKLQRLKDEHGPETFSVNELFSMHTFFGMVGTKSLYSALTLDVAPLSGLPSW
jgi:anaerobic selenocysteine-containing dehydrogenase